MAALRGVDVELAAGEFTAIMGPSGSGKSTLVHCLAGLDAITDGEAFIGDAKVSGMSEKQLTEPRRSQIDLICQQFNLLPTLTAEEDIQLPLAIAGCKPRRTRR